MRILLLLCSWSVLLAAADVQDLAIRGWWSLCNFAPEFDEPRCGGTFVSIPDENLVPLDTTGNTCYVNIAAEDGGVSWFGKYSQEALDANELLRDGVHMFSLALTATATDEYLPTNCTVGICSCESIEPLRVGWQNTTSFCAEGPCFATSASFAGAFKAEECSFDSAISGVDPDTDECLYGACFLLAALEDLTAIIAPTEPPTQMPSASATETNVAAACVLGAVVLSAAQLL